MSGTEDTSTRPKEVPGATSVIDPGVANVEPSIENRPNENVEAEKPQVDYKKLWKQNLDSLTFINNVFGDEFLKKIMDIRVEAEEKARIYMEQINAGSGRPRDSATTGEASDDSCNKADTKVRSEKEANRSTRPKDRKTAVKDRDTSLSSNEDEKERRPRRSRITRSASSRIKTEVKRREPSTESDSEDPCDRRMKRPLALGWKTGSSDENIGKSRRNTITYIGRKTGKGVPEPEKFEVISDQDFQIFLDDFERYCKSEYSSDRRD